MWNRTPDVVSRWLDVDTEVMGAEAAIAQSFVFSSADLERLARMRANAELRRSMVLREMEGRRELQTLQRLREAAQTFEDRSLEARFDGVSAERPPPRSH